jgi:hypothetical protein
MSQVGDLNCEENEPAQVSMAVNKSHANNPVVSCCKLITLKGKGELASPVWPGNSLALALALCFSLPWVSGLNAVLGQLPILRSLKDEVVAVVGAEDGVDAIAPAKFAT